MNTDEVEQLLTICNLAKNWPNLLPIHDSAMLKLLDIAKSEKEALDKKKEEAMKAEGARIAAVEAKAKADAKAAPAPLRPIPVSEKTNG